MNELNGGCGNCLCAGEVVVSGNRYAVEGNGVALIVLKLLILGAEGVAYNAVNLYVNGSVVLVRCDGVVVLKNDSLVTVGFRNLAEVGAVF